MSDSSVLVIRSSDRSTWTVHIGLLESPTATSSPTPAAATLQPNAVGWVSMGDPGMGYADLFHASASNGEVAVVSGSRVTEPLTRVDYWTTWSTRDGIKWSASGAWEEFRDRAIASIELAPFRDGFAALVHVDDLGTSAQLSYVYLSPDGNEWTLAATLDGIRIVSVVNANGTLIAAGWDADYQGGLWLSSDGVTWTRSPDSAAAAVNGRSKLATFESRTVLITSVVDETLDGGDIWVSDDSGATWSHANEPKTVVTGDSDWDGTLVGGPTGWVFAGWFYNGSNAGWFSWWSPNGLDWQESENTPHGVETIVGYAGGFAAGGYSSSQPCCALGGEGEGVSWFSADGARWRQIANDTWRNHDLELLAINRGTLVGLTTDMTSDRAMPAGLWLANLDSVRRVGGRC